MKKSESIKSIAKALSQLQAAIKAAPFDSINPHFKNKYASLNSVAETIQPHLLKNGLSYTQGETEDGTKLSTMIMHESGEWIESFTSLVLDKQSMQGLGSAQSYARRYGLSSAFGVVSDEDDDAEIASQPAPPKSDLATTAQLNMLFAIAKSKQKDLQAIAKTFGYSASKDIKFSDVNKIKAEIEK